MFASYGKSLFHSSITFVSQAAHERGIASELGLQKRIEPVVNCRNIGKKDMIRNDATPVIVVDPDTYKVTVDGEHAICEPMSVVPMAQRYYLF